MRGVTSYSTWKLVSVRRYLDSDAVTDTSSEKEGKEWKRRKELRQNCIVLRRGTSEAGG